MKIMRMPENDDSLFIDERNLLLAKLPVDEGAPFEYIFLHNDEKEFLRFVVFFFFSINCINICTL